MMHFERGDIVHLTLDPVVGHEQAEQRFALVLTEKPFNRLGMVLLAPITQRGNFARANKLEVQIFDSDCKGDSVSGVILLNQIRMLDINNANRNIKFRCKCSTDIVEDFLSRVQALVSF